MAPLGFLFYRNEPEKFGLLPDGKEPKLVNNGATIEENHKQVESEFSDVDDVDDSDDKRDGDNIDVTAREAFKTGAFWSNALSLVFILMIDNNIDNTMMLQPLPFWFHLNLWEKRFFSTRL